MSINQESETVTLDKLKTIDVAKIILNEERLSQKIDSLRTELDSLSDSLLILAVRYQNSVKRIQELSDQLQGSQKKVLDLTNEQLETEKKKKPWGMYITGSIAGNQNKLWGTYGGLAFARRKTLITFSVDPFLGDTVIFQAGVGFRIF